MRLTKFFPGSKSIDKDINAWVKEYPQQRCILQIVPYKGGAIVLYESTSSRKNEWESLKRSLTKKKGVTK